MTEEKKHKKVFVEGPITPIFIADSLAKHAAKHNIGAHSMFMGQVRADVKEDGQVVTGIEYEAYQEMAMETLHQIREDAFAKYSLTCMHIYHSLGLVKTGDISLFVFTSSVQRRAAIEACDYLVERIKREVQVWGKEILESGETVWKRPG
ncbi:MAG: molybdenum cofactor biosynthesis protein MoaE [Bacteroidetes bacterium]|nr:molybdenum cofactor biosynthesis protein MoaE [Bacteroidota bacterium]